MARSFFYFKRLKFRSRERRFSDVYVSRKTLESAVALDDVVVDTLSIQD